MSRDIWSIFEFDQEVHSGRMDAEATYALFERIFGPRPTPVQVLCSDAWHRKARQEQALWFGTNVAGDRRGS